MNPAVKDKIHLYKELHITQDDDTGAKITYTCYEALPNGGFCIISAMTGNQSDILSQNTYIKNTSALLKGLDMEFFPTLIEAINAYKLIQKNSAS